MNIDESVCLERVRYLREYVFLHYVVAISSNSSDDVDQQLYPSNYDFEILSNREVIFLLFCHIRRLII